MSLDAFVPDPLDSIEQYLRYWHFDLAELEDNELADEFYALRPMLWRLPTEHWLRKRVSALHDEMTRRRYSTKDSKDIRPKPQLAEGVKL